MSSELEAAVDEAVAEDLAVEENEQVDAVKETRKPNKSRKKLGKMRPVLRKRSCR